MSFSTDCKKELSLLKPDRRCCLLSELGGLYASIGSLNLLGGGRVSVQLSAESMAVARRAYTLLVQGPRLTPQIHYVTNARFGGKRRCVLTLGPKESPELLVALGMMRPDAAGGYALRATTPQLRLTRLCCARAFVRGVFLGGGTAVSPEQGYRLELPYRDEDVRKMLCKCLRRMGIDAAQSQRRKKGYLYLSQSEQLVTLLSALGANAAVMRVEDLRVRRQVLGAVNRAMNCDNANLKKLMSASQRQLKAIDALAAGGGLERLPDALRQIALERLAHPDATLEELGAALDPPLSKSAVNHRMRRLLALAPTSLTPDSQEEDP